MVRSLADRTFQLRFPEAKGTDVRVLAIEEDDPQCEKNPSGWLTVVRAGKVRAYVMLFTLLGRVYDLGRGLVG